MRFSLESLLDFSVHESTRDLLNQWRTKITWGPLGGNMIVLDGSGTDSPGMHQCCNIKFRCLS